jgi:hypothetical protein
MIQLYIPWENTLTIQILNSIFQLFVRYNKAVTALWPLPRAVIVYYINTSVDTEMCINDTIVYPLGGGGGGGAMMKIWSKNTGPDIKQK